MNVLNHIFQGSDVLIFTLNWGWAMFLRCSTICTRWTGDGRLSWTGRETIYNFYSINARGKRDFGIETVETSCLSFARNEATEGVSICPFFCPSVRLSVTLLLSSLLGVFYGSVSGLDVNAAFCPLFQKIETIYMSEMLRHKRFGSWDRRNIGGWPIIKANQQARWQVGRIRRDKGNNVFSDKPSGWEEGTGKQKIWMSHWTKTWKYLKENSFCLMEYAYLEYAYLE